MTDYYQILGVSPTATQEDIQRRYQFLAQAFHPDRFPEGSAKAEAEEQMKLINQAHRVLSNPEKRREYDRQDTTEFSEESRTENEYEAELARIMAYITSVVEKWSLVFQPLPEDRLAKQISDDLGKAFLDLIRLVIPSTPESEQVSIYSAFSEKIPHVMMINLALGAEEYSRGIDPAFPRNRLRAFSASTVQVALDDFIEQHSQPTYPRMTEVANLIAEIGNLTARLGERCWVLGFGLIKRGNLPKQQTYASASPPPASYDASSDPAPVLSYCESCGRRAEVMPVTFGEHIGLIRVRFKREIKGRFCAHCIEHYFWEFTTKTLFLGWWGIISFFATVATLSGNFDYYGRSKRLRRKAYGMNKVARGYKTLIWGSFGALMIFGLVFLIPNITSSSHSPRSVQGGVVVYATPTKITKSIITTAPVIPTKVAPEPTSTNLPNPTRTPDSCRNWSQITVSDQFRNLCVEGVVQDVYPDPDHPYFYVFFGFDNDDFVLVYPKEYYMPNLIGFCIQTYGVVRIFEDTRGPFMFIDGKVSPCK